jgi:hypothetical protein
MACLGGVRPYTLAMQCVVQKPSRTAAPAAHVQHLSHTCIFLSVSQTNQMREEPRLDQTAGLAVC